VKLLAEPIPDGDDEADMLKEAVEAAEALGADRNDPLGLPPQVELGGMSAGSARELQG
jgi:hypothetical protein